MFDTMIRDIVERRDSGLNTISDGEAGIAYRDLPRRFEELDRQFAGGGAEDWFAFPCGNSLAEAVLLLWLLWRKRSFLLMPRGGGLEIPSFCRCVVTVNIEAGAVELRGNANVSAAPAWLKREPALLLKTSGSTAAPKMALHHHRRLAVNVRNCVARFGVAASDRLLIPVPLYHMYGLGAGFLPAVCAGASVSLMEGTNIIRLLDREKTFKPTAAMLTPTLIAMMLRGRKGDYPYRLAVTAGDRIGEDEMARFEERFGVLFNLYGSTELGAIATTNPCDPTAVRYRAAVRPLADVEIQIDPYIRCRHGSGFECYVDMAGNRLEGTDDGWFATGDLGNAESEGRFRVLGRAGNSQNRNGILVAFAEVESLMEKWIDGIDHAVVVAAAGETERGKRMTAFCQLQKRSALTAAEIRGRAFDVLPRHQVPDEVRVLAEIPRLPNGKFDRKALERLVNYK